MNNLDNNGFVFPCEYYNYRRNIRRLAKWCDRIFMLLIISFILLGCSEGLLAAIRFYNAGEANVY
jgi:hypothetical protein